MNRGLVVVADTDRHRALLETAGEFAAGADAELVVLATLSRDEINDGKDALKEFERIEGVDYGVDSFQNQLEQRTEVLANDVLDDQNIVYEVVPRIVNNGSEADEILDAAAELDIDHVFIVGQKRSPTGKALFGDVAQSVILGFDGRVTVDLE